MADAPPVLVRQVAHQPHGVRKWRRSVFTLHDPDRAAHAQQPAATGIAAMQQFLTNMVTDLGGQPGPVKYLGCQLEETKASGLHAQGVLYHEPCTLQRLVDLPFWGPSRPHFERMRGSWSQAVAYTKKADSRVVDQYWEWGVPPSQGSRSDLEDIYRRLRERDESLREVADAFPGQFMRYHRAFKAAQLLCTPRGLNDCTRGYFFYGEPGTGKSRLARSIVGEEGFYAPCAEGKWFDGIQPGMLSGVIDDIQPDTFPVDVFLHLIDYGPYQVPVKCSWGVWKLKHLIFTSNYEWDQLWPRHRHPNAIKRRFEIIVKFRHNGTLHFDKGTQADLDELLQL